MSRHELRGMLERAAADATVDREAWQRWADLCLDRDDAAEVRVVDPDTGGAKGQKLARFDLLPADALFAVAEHFGRGAAKYGDRNWELGYAWSLSFAAMQRHAWQWWSGEDDDPETGTSHLAAVAFHALALLSNTLRDSGTDDRP